MIKSNLISALAVIVIVVISVVSISESSTITGFTADLIHRDSHLPLSQRLLNTLKRSVHRSRRFNKLHQQVKNPGPDLFSVGGEYLLNFTIGTPPVPTIAIADTGSDVVWTQCQPCLQCFNQTLPLFSPRRSASYARLPCGTAACSSVRNTRCSRTRRSCLFSVLYGDGSFTEGMFATDVFTFPSAAGKPVVIPNIVFGCGFQNGGTFSGTESGIVGLGAGKASLVRQLGQGRFSYCLVPFRDHSSTSKLSFGADAEVSGGGVVTTPLISKKGAESYYFLTVEGISVGKKRVEFRHNSSSKVGNIAIDSGTTLTLLPAYVYAAMEAAIKSEVEKLKQIKDPSGVLDLCFETKGAAARDFPTMVVHFEGGDVKWGFDNGFVRTSEDAVCLAAKASGGSFAIYGNFAQVNFLVGYHLLKRTVSFKPARCGRSS